MCSARSICFGFVIRCCSKLQRIVAYQLDLLDDTRSYKGVTFLLECFLLPLVENFEFAGT